MVPAKFRRHFNSAIKQVNKMKDIQNSDTRMKPNPIWLYAAMSSILMSCASTSGPADIKTIKTSSASQNVNYANETTEKSSISVNQIGNQTSTLAAPQIAATLDTNRLSVEQLKAYADRCSPNAVTPPPQGLDCSEINLRIERMLQSDDLVNDALITLDRLGRNRTIDDNLEDLKNGRPGSSLNSQAIAGGILDPVTPTPTEPEPNTLDLLKENGVNFDIGAIIPTQ